MPFVIFFVLISNFSIYTQITFSQFMLNSVKHLLVILFTALAIPTFGQTKAELIAAIKEINILKNDEPGLLDILYDDEVITLPSKRDNYANFKALVRLIDSTELVKMGSDENPILRMYAIRELLERQNKNFDFYQAFVKELENCVIIIDHQGCERSANYTYHILFDDLSRKWNRTIDDKEKRDFEFVDNILKKIDLHLLYSKADLPETMFETILERRKYGEEHIGRIRKIIYTSDNFYAFTFLMKNYPNEFKRIESDYIKRKLSKRKFDIKKHPESFYQFVNYSTKIYDTKLQSHLLKQYHNLDNMEGIEWLRYQLDTIKTPKEIK